MRRANTLKIWAPLVFIIGGLAMQSSFASPMYVTAPADNLIYVLDDGVVIDSWSTVHQGNYIEAPIAVSDTIHTMGPFGMSSSRANIGAEYTLDGVPTGALYPTPCDCGDFWDGTTDGISNYSWSFNGGQAYQFSLEWSDPTPLPIAHINTDNSALWLGITYDLESDAIWISSFGRATSVVDTNGHSTLENWSLDGVLLSSFTVPVFQISALALDPVDGSLWFYDNFSETGAFYQYDQAGQFLSTVVYSELAGRQIMGGEFRMHSVPEPATLVLFGLGLAGIGFSRRKKA